MAGPGTRRFDSADRPQWATDGRRARTTAPRRCHDGRATHRRRHMTTYHPNQCGACGRPLRRPRPLGMCDECRPVFVAELVAEYARMAGDDPNDLESPQMRAAIAALDTAIGLARGDRGRTDQAVAS